MDTTTKADVGTRIASMFLDHVIMTIFCMLFFIPMMIKAFMGVFVVSHEQMQPIAFTGPLYYIALFGFALYFCKDSLGGRSIAKRLTKLQIIDNRTGEAASPIRCFLRNIFIIIWPVEVIATIINPARRLGDYVAGTSVVRFDKTKVQPTGDFKKALLPFLLSLGLIVLITLPLKSWQPNFQQVRYVKTSYNATASKALEQLYTDSLGQMLTADVRVYDKIENQDLKYISVIYNLKENYLENNDPNMDIELLATKHLYAMFPKNTFTGYAQYVYRTSTSVNTTGAFIGTQAPRK